MEHQTNICAVILAAGRSRRMGQPKLLMPWDGSTVIAHVVSVLRDAGINHITAVTGAHHAQIAEAVNPTGTPVLVQTVLNPDYAETEMLVSLQVGLRELNTKCEAALVVLGDQPTITAAVVRAVVDAYYSSAAPLVIPSYRMRRGHPWLIKRDLWPALLSMPAEQTPRDFLEAHKTAIHYVVMDAPEVLEDLDTPEDYRDLQDPKRSPHT